MGIHFPVPNCHRGFTGTASRVAGPWVADIYCIEADAATDFWQRTHYGFQVDNGHFLYREMTGDFVPTARILFRPVHQYDQAGIMVRVSADCWLKCSVEFEPSGPNRLGAVVTNHGYSDWSTQNFPRHDCEVWLRIR
jgi:regulation of enolase protein 1 (concanavalin A-like superfamily)